MAQQKSQPKRQRKSKKTQPKEQTVELSTEPVVEPVVESNPVVEPVVEPVVSNDTEVQPTEEVDELTQLSSKIQEKLSQVNQLQRELIADMKSLDKLQQRERKKYSKKTRKRSDNPNRKPSGFAKPSLLSDELCKFVSKPKNSMMARTEVTKFITGYIKEHDLQDPQFKRRILPDTKLNKLLKVPKGQELTYFNLQTYMKVHFPKPVVTQS